MSKSYGNAIFLSDDEETTRKKVLSMVTDTNRVYKKDPGEPDRCIAFTLHSLYVPEAKREEIVVACRGAELGCVDCKKILAGCMIDTLAPFRAKRIELAEQEGLVRQVLTEGSRKAEVAAKETMTEVRAALKV
jgi:tryptophanyl-tRNA synthetase